MPYLYESNVSHRDRFEQLQLQLDSGSTVILRRGQVYNLTANEYARASRFVVLTQSSSQAVAPTEVARLPIVGTPADGQVPVWSSSVGAFVPGDAPTGSGGGTSQLWVWNGSTYVPSSTVRQFTGPVDPKSIVGINATQYDSWTPTENPP